MTLIRAGLPILGSLDMLVKGQKNPTFRAQLENVAARVRTGESLSGAFEAQGGFPLIYTTTLLAGERSGQLEDVLSRYLAFQRISLSFRKKLMASLLYPCLLITMVVALFVFLISFVVPRFAMLYDQLGTNLPAVTRMLLAVGNNFQHYILVGAGRHCDHRLCSVSLQPDHGRRGADRPHADRHAGIREYLAQVPGRAVSCARFRAC